MTFDMSRFYDNAYWQDDESEGQMLWNMRKLLAFIMIISSPTTPTPFLTVLHKSDYGTGLDNWAGWYASWQEGANDSLTLEWENKSFIISALDIDEETNKVEHAFWYEFGFDGTVDHGWDKMDEAIEACRSWLVEHEAVLTKMSNSDSLKKLFNIK